MVLPSTRPFGYTSHKTFPQSSCRLSRPVSSRRLRWCGPCWGRASS